MVVTSGDSHFFEMGLQFLNDGGNDRGILVGDFGIINIPTDGTLGALNQAVGNAMVVWVEDETHRFEGLGKEFIPQEGRLNATVQGLDKTHVQGGDTVFGDDESAVGRVNFTEKANGVAGEFHDDEITHVGVEIGTSHVSSGDISAFIGIN
jgi:hypothetical protein